MKKAIVLGTVLVLALSCKDEITEKAKETIDKGGKAVEKTANRVVDEVTAHIDRDKGSKIELSEELKEKGINTGKFYIERDSITKTDNKLVVYLIADKDFKGNVTFRVTDSDGIESGRTTFTLNRKAGSAGYEDILFDKRTDIESKSTISIY